MLLPTFISVTSDRQKKGRIAGKTEKVPGIEKTDTEHVLKFKSTLAA